MNIADLIEFQKRLREGDATAEQVRQRWEEWKASREAVKAELGSMTKAELGRFASYASSADKKERLVQDAYSSLSRSFVSGSALCYGVVTSLTKDSERDAIDAQMGSWTDELIQTRAAERKERIQAHSKAITNPETLAEFDRFVEFHGRRAFDPEELKLAKSLRGKEQEDYLQERGEKKLSPEKRIKYDELRALAGREIRDQRAAAKKDVPAEEVPSGVTLNITETKHTVKGHALWVVRMSERVERQVFNDLSVRARKLGGYYSSFAKNGAVPGFQFDSAEKAEAFASLKEIDGAQRHEEKKVEQQIQAAARLTEVGERAIQRGEAELQTERKTNTERRASMASSVEASARQEIRFGETAASIGAGIADGQAKFLAKVNTGSKVATLESMIRMAQIERIRDLTKKEAASGRSFTSSWEKESAKPYGEEDIAHTKFPYPVFHVSQMMRAVAEGSKTNGAKLAAGRVQKLIDRTSKADDLFTCQSEYQVELVRDLAKRIRDNQYLLERFTHYDRLQNMDVRNVVELRAALREYLPHRASLQEADPIVKAERELVGRKIPGFLPTPKSFAAEVVDRAEISANMRVLEPSAGKGDLAEAVSASAHEVKIDVIEINSTLSDLLQKKGFEVTFRGDFLQFNPGPRYDRIVMNPPFEDGQDIDHVKHAHSLLAPGGRLVAIMSEGPFFRSDRKAEEFRAWLNDLFSSSEAFRQTGTRTRLVQVDKAPERIDNSVTQEPLKRMSRIAV